MLKSLKELEENMRFSNHIGSGAEYGLEKLLEIIIEQEEAKMKAVEEMQNKCRTCTAPHCGICEKFLNVVKKC